MRRWAYCAFNLDDLPCTTGSLFDELNRLGSEGWELCHVTNYSVYILKRPSSPTDTEGPYR